MLIGYARVSTTDQNPALQMDALKAAGCNKIFVDRASGAHAGNSRPELAKALAYNNKGDVFVVWKLDRLGRSLSDLLGLTQCLEQRGVAFKVLTQPIDTSTAVGKLMFSFLGAFAEFERELIRERTKAGLAVARAQGRRGGRKSKLTEEMLKEAREKKSMGLKDREITAALGVSRATYYRIRKMHQHDRAI